MVASIGAVASPSQGAQLLRTRRLLREGLSRTPGGERVGGPGRGRALGLEGPVDPDTFSQVLAGEVPDGSGNGLDAGSDRGRSTTVPAGT